MQSTVEGKHNLHVAIIMDGNGRWATRRGLPRSAGHRAGVNAVRHMVEAAPDLGVTTLTLFVFSSDNWRRPEQEVSTLMTLLRHFLRTELRRLNESGTRLTIIGRRDRLPRGLSDAIAAAERTTAANTRLSLQIALDYSARDAIANAAAQWRAEHPPSRRRSAVSSRPRSARPAAMSTCSSAAAAKSASPTSCCGNPPTRSSTSSKPCGPISAPNTCAPQSPISAAGNGVSAGFPPRLRSSRPSDLPLMRQANKP
jgi:hypothetical protein